MDDEAGQLVDVRRQLLAGERRAPFQREAARRQVRRRAVVVRGVVVLDKQDLARHVERVGANGVPMLNNGRPGCKVGNLGRES